MAKIDVTHIDGYAEMTAEQKVAALEGYEIDTTGYVKKSVYDKTASDLAAAKKALGERKSPDESKAADDKIKELEKKLNVMDLEKKFISNGFSSDDATKAANAYYEGDTETFFELQQSRIEAVKKSVEAKMMNQTPPPQSGNDTGSGKDYAKQIEQAQAAGNFALAASLMTKQFEEIKKDGGNI